MAKACGVGVPVFSIGFGRRLFGIRWRGTDYRVSLLPFGGYVRMEGADPFQDGGEGADTSSPTSFMGKPVWQRLLIVAAGPAMNLVLPIVVFTMLFMGGQPQAASTVGRVDFDSPAWDAGLRGGERVIAIDGEAVTLWGDLSDRMAAAEGEFSLTFVRPDGTSLGVVFDADADVPLYEGARGPWSYGLSFNQVDATVAFDDPNSPAGVAGLQLGDVITHVGDVEVESYRGLLAALEPGGTVTYERLVDDEPVTGTATLERSVWTPRSDDPYGNTWGLAPATLFVADISPDSPAERANLLPGDRVLAVNGLEVSTFAEIVERVSESASEAAIDASTQPVQLTLVRKGRVIEVGVVPEMIEDSDAYGNYQIRPIIGFTGSGGLLPSELERVYYPLTEAFPKAVDTTWTTSVMIVETVGKIFTGEADPSKTVGGPVRIVKAAKDAAESGLFEWAGLMAGLSVSLAIVNFLPVPVLDGGQLLFYLIEGIRGRPLSLQVRERAQQIGVLLLVGLMFIVFVMDINGILGGGG